MGIFRAVSLPDHFFYCKSPDLKEVRAFESGADGGGIDLSSILTQFAGGGIGGGGLMTVIGLVRSMLAK